MNHEGEEPDLESNSNTYIYKQGNQYTEKSITYGLGWCSDSSNKLDNEEYCSDTNRGTRNECNNNGYLIFGTYDPASDSYPQVCECQRGNTSENKCSDQIVEKTGYSIRIHTDLNCGLNS